MKIISSENIIKSYGEGNEKRNVLDGVSMCVNTGEFVSIMGPSGCGKSTLLFAISGMDHIDSGAAYFDGKKLSELREQELSDLRRTQMGFIFQQPTMLKNLNILDNIVLSSVMGNRKATSQIMDKAKALMKKVGIADLSDRDITQVSGGQLQRAGICRALTTSPQIIFGDEPTGALNSKSSDEIMDILLEINAEGTAVLLVTHDAKIAARTERILFMCDGKIISEMQLARWRGQDADSRMKKITAKMQDIGI